MNPIEISLVIPTYNERDNVEPLLSELSAALVGTSWEALFVDDSNDGTDSVIAAISETDPHVRLLHRAVNCGGLAGAVVDGLAQAEGEYICVIDADLQHPPAMAPAMLCAAREASADVVIASRYIPGGSAGGLDGPLRQFYSRGLKTLTCVVFPRQLAGISDPLGGYFLVRGAVVKGVELRPIGYKILLEILVRSHWRGVREVPYQFQPRRHGTSKANIRQGLTFLKHLMTLLWECSPSFALPRRVMSHPAERSARSNEAAAKAIQ